MSIDPYFLEFQLYNITGFMWNDVSKQHWKVVFIGIPNEQIWEIILAGEVSSILSHKRGTWNDEALEKKIPFEQKKT